MGLGEVGGRGGCGWRVEGLMNSFEERGRIKAKTRLLASKVM